MFDSQSSIVFHLSLISPKIQNPLPSFFSSSSAAVRRSECSVKLTNGRQRWAGVRLAVVSLPADDVSRPLEREKTMKLKIF